MIPPDHTQATAALYAPARRAAPPDLVTFSRRLGIEPDPWQRRMMDHTGKRILLNCHRQAGKTLSASIMILHQFVYFPGSLTIVISPSERQSKELLLKVTKLMPFLGDDAPKLTEENKLSLTATTGSRVVSLPSSEATVRGFSGVALIVEDEASRVPDDLYRAVRPMMATSGGKMILMTTPFGKRGHFYEEWVGDADWLRIEAKAPECTHFTPGFLDAERGALGEWWFKQEYLCEFVETTDQVFSYDSVMQAISDDVQPLFL